MKRNCLRWYLENDENGQSDDIWLVATNTWDFAKWRQEEWSNAVSDNEKSETESGDGSVDPELDRKLWNARRINGASNIDSYGMQKVVSTIREVRR